MKGKIYKNKLNTTCPSTSPNDYLNTQISSIIPPYGHRMHQANSPGSQLMSPKPQHPKKSFIHQFLNENPSQSNRNNPHTAMNTFIEQLNHQFTNGYGQQTHAHGSLNNGNNHIMAQINSPIQQKLSRNRNASLKRVVSNPNITSYHFLAMQQNREEEIDPIDEASILDNSLHSNFSKFRVKINNYNTKNNNQFNELFDNVQQINPLTNTHALSHIKSQNHLTGTSLYNSPSYHQKVRSNNPLLQGQNLMYANDTSFLRLNQPFAQTDYITQYEKRHKERVAALESQHQLEVQFYQQEIRNRDQTIEEMKKLLKQKEDIIKRLKSENANLSSRSFISFANGNIIGKD